MNQRRFLVTGAMALLMGAVVAVVLWPVFDRTRRLNALNGLDDEARIDAIEWLTQSTPGLAPRVVRDDDLRGRVIEAMATARDDVFVQVIDSLREVGAWRFDEVGADPWLRWLELRLTRDDFRFESVLIDLERVQEHEAALPLYLRMMSLAPDDDGRERVLVTALRNTPPDHYGAIFEQGLQSASAHVRRLSWVAVGVLRPDTGFAANWLEEEASVAEAILWAVARTAADPSVILNRAFELRPDLTKAWPFLRCAHLSPDAALDCQTGLASRDARSLAWFGGAASPTDEVSRRWTAWRGGRPSSDESIRRLVDPPVAEDGSVWAAAMLAHRRLSIQAREDLLHRWMASRDREERRAGVLLGALAEDFDSIRKLADETWDKEVHRLARVALAIDASATRKERREARLLAWRIYADEPTGVRTDPILLLFLLDDPNLLESILSPADSGALTDSVLRYAWMIEHTRPQLIAASLYLDPWNDDTAALQRDILRIAEAMHGAAADG